MTEWEGVFPLWKDAGMTSHDCVSRARRLFRMKRIGHTGTLDPDVSGVLPLCLGRGTRIVEYLQELPKTYEAEMTIGYATDTEDASGRVIETAEYVDLSEQKIQEAAASFVGEIEQKPPMYSAVKVDGKRLYELARAGIELERKPRAVTIHALEITAIERAGERMVVRFTVTCSKGTYIRTLCADLGRALGYPAVMSKLTRTASGPFGPEDCVTFEEAEKLIEQGSMETKIVPVGDALAFLPRGSLSDAAVVPALQGRKIYEAAISFDVAAAETVQGANDRAQYGLPSEQPLVRLFGGARFVGIYRKQLSDDAGVLYVPVKLFT